MKSILIEKLNRSRVKPARIALIGYRATGKTTIGKKLSEILAWNFADTDNIIEEKELNTIEDIVNKQGWEYFRQLEASVLRSMASQDQVVVSTGGGIILAEENRKILKKHFFVVWLQASSDVIKMRLMNDSEKHQQRPSLSGKNIIDEVDKILESRLKLYRDTADITVSTEKYDPDEVIDIIIRNLEERVQHA